MKATIAGMESERPNLQTEYSREYTEKTNATRIFKILKTIIERYERADFCQTLTKIEIVLKDSMNFYLRRSHLRGVIGLNPWAKGGNFCNKFIS